MFPAGILLVARKRKHGVAVLTRFFFCWFFIHILMSSEVKYFIHRVFNVAVVCFTAYEHDLSLGCASSKTTIVLKGLQDKQLQ